MISQLTTVANSTKDDFVNFKKEVSRLVAKYDVPEPFDRVSMILAMLARMNENFARLQNRIVLRK